MEEEGRWPSGPTDRVLPGCRRDKERGRDGERESAGEREMERMGWIRVYMVNFGASLPLTHSLSHTHTHTLSLSGASKRAREGWTWLISAPTPPARRPATSYVLYAIRARMDARTPLSSLSKLGGRPPNFGIAQGIYGMQYSSVLRNAVVRAHFRLRDRGPGDLQWGGEGWTRSGPTPSARRPATSCEALPRIQSR